MQIRIHSIGLVIYLQSLCVVLFYRELFLGEGEPVWSLGCSSGAVLAIEAIGVGPLAGQAVGEAGSPLVVPVLRIAWFG